MGKLRLGYVGCGFMAQKVHIPNILSLEEECELVAVAEVRKKLGEKVCKRYGIPALYRSHRELAQDPTVEAVAVSGHFANQGEIAADLLLSGKDVFMEKPMAVSVSQAQRILEAERLSGKRLMIGYMKHFDAGNLLAKRKIDEFRASGELGKVRYIRNSGFGGEWIGGLDTPFDTTDEPIPETVCPYPDWLPQEHYKGYINYIQQFTHNVNMLRWLLDAGENVKVISVTLDPADHYTGVAVLEVAGVTAILESGWVEGHTWHEQTQVYFQGGWVRSESPTLLMRNDPARIEIYVGNQPDKGLSRMFPENGRTWPYKEEMRHFVDAIKNNKPLRTTARDALIDVRLLEEIYKKHVESAGVPYTP
jgi:predicted dehydrogenase